MTIYALGVFLWLLGVLFSLGAAGFDGQFESRSLAEDALRAALIWPLVLLPWREWLPSYKPGKHSMIGESS